MFSIIVRCPGFVTRLQQISIEPLDFPPFSVTQTLIRANTHDCRRFLVPEVSASGIFSNKSKIGSYFSGIETVNMIPLLRR